MKKNKKKNLLRIEGNKVYADKIFLDIFKAKKLVLKELAFK